MSLKNITKLHDIIERALCTIEPPIDYHRTIEALLTLSKLLNKRDKFADSEGEEVSAYEIGEHSGFDVQALVVGCYWYCTDNYMGQGCELYELLSSLDGIYSPGVCETETQPDTMERDFYNYLTELQEG